MKDYVIITGYVSSGKYSVINKKTQKIKKYEFGFFDTPTVLDGSIRKKREYVSDETIDEIKQEIENIFDKDSERMYANNKKWTLHSYEFNICYTVEKASEQSVKWCIENLTVQELISMGLTIIKG